MKRLTALLLMISIFMIGCGEKSKEGAFSIIKKSLDDLKTYMAEANIELYNNKTIKKFSMKQFYKNNKYRMEILDESGKPDKIIVYDNNRSYIYFSKVNQTFIEDNSKNIPSYSLIKSFIDNLRNAGEMSKKFTNDGYIIKVPITIDNNNFMYSEEMLFSKKDYKPLLLKIYNINEKLFAKISYKNIKYNCDISDEIFQKSLVSTFSNELKLLKESSIDIKDVYKYTGINPALPKYMPRGYTLINVNIEKSRNNEIYLTYLKGNDIIKIIEDIKSDMHYNGYIKRKSDYITYYKKGNEYILDKNGLCIRLISNNNVDEYIVSNILKSFD